MLCVEQHMSRTNLSVLFAPAFDSKKIFIITMVLAVTLFVDEEIGTISDMIPEKISSSIGLATFLGIWMIFSVSQFYILAYVKKSNKEIRVEARYLNLMHGTVTIAQYVLAGVIALVILQMFVTHEYNTSMLYARYIHKLWTLDCNLRSLS